MHQLTANEIRKKFVEKEVSAEEITRYFLEHIDKIDHKVGAFLTLFPEQALKRAKELDTKRDAGQHLGRLAAVPVAIKDNIHIEGEITSCGSKFLTNYRAPFNATATERLLAEDAILIGKTNLDEFAMGSSTENSALLETRNPWNLDCVPGGSSGGSAAAVAARLVPIALGSDTGGSIRQPGSFCGVVGYKPTYGAVSRYGLVAFGSSLDQIGPLTNSVDDAITTMEIISGPCQKDSTSLPKKLEGLSDPLPSPLTIGVPWKFLEQLNSETREIFEKSLEIFKERGAKIIDVNLDILSSSLAVYYILATAEASTNLARFDGVRYGRRSEKAETLSELYNFSRTEGFGPEVKRRIMLGTFVLSSGYQDSYYRKAQKVRTKIIEAYKEAFKACDIIATPVAPTGAFELGEIRDPVQMYLADIYTIGCNLSGVPAVSVPAGFTSEKKPMGLQIIGPQLCDGRVLAAAKFFEEQLNLNPKMPEWICHNG